MDELLQFALDNVGSMMILVLVAIGVKNGIRTLRDTERGVLFRLGRFVKVVGPGIQLIFPIIDKLYKVDIEKNIPGWQGMCEEDIEKRVRDLVLSDPNVLNR